MQFSFAPHTWGQVWKKLKKFFKLGLYVFLVVLYMQHVRDSFNSLTRKPATEQVQKNKEVLMKNNKTIEMDKHAHKNMPNKPVTPSKYKAS